MNFDLGVRPRSSRSEISDGVILAYVAPSLDLDTRIETHRPNSCNLMRREACRDCVSHSDSQPIMWRRAPKIALVFHPGAHPRRRIRKEGRDQSPNGAPTRGPKAWVSSNIDVVRTSVMKHEQMYWSEPREIRIHSEPLLKGCCDSPLCPPSPSVLVRKREAGANPMPPKARRRALPLGTRRRRHPGSRLGSHGAPGPRGAHSEDTRKRNTPCARSTPPASLSMPPGALPGTLR